METMFADIDFFHLSSSIFNEIHVLIEEGNPSEKIVIVEDELDGIDGDDIWNLKDLLRLVLINEECGNPIESLPKRTFYKPVDVHSVRNAMGKCMSSISIWNIVNHLDKHDFSCRSVVDNLKEMQLFSDQINRNHFDLILARRYWNCSTIENLRQRYNTTLRDPNKRKMRLPSE